MRAKPDPRIALPDPGPCATMYAMPLRTDTPQPGTSTTPPVALAVGSVAAAHSSGPANGRDLDYPLGWHGDQA